MRYIKTIIFAVLFALVMPMSQATAGDTTMVYTQEQVDRIVAEEVQRQVRSVVKDSLEQWADSKIIDLKIDKVANEKLGAVLTRQDTLQAEHDSLISHQLTLIAIIFTVLAAIIGILIPWLMNRNIEKKLDENTKGLEKSSEDLEKSKKELEESKKKLEENTKGLEDSKKELEESKQRLSNSEKIMEDTRRELERSKKELSDLKDEIVKIHDDVAQMNKAAKESKDDAEKAARQSKFSEKLSQVWNENDFNKQIEMVNQLMKDYQEDGFMSKLFYARGTSLLNNGENSKAVEDLTRAIENNHEYVEAYNNRGVAFNNMGDYDKAISDFTVAIGLMPNYVLAFCNRGASYYNKGSWDDAINDYSEAIRLDPDNIKAYIARCDANRVERRFDEADKDAKQGLEIAKRQGKTDLIEVLEKKIKEIAQAKSDWIRTMEE